VQRAVLYTGVEPRELPGHFAVLLNIVTFKVTLYIGCSVRFFIQGLNLIDFLAIFPFYMTAIVAASGLSANHTEACV